MPKYKRKVIIATAALLDAKIDLSQPLPADLQMAAIEMIARRTTGPTPADLMRLWNEKRNPVLSECLYLMPSRKRAARARLKEFPNQKDWENFLGYINSAPWCLGQGTNKKHAGWKATFDFFVKPGAIVKFLEGAYTLPGAQEEGARERYASELERRNEIHDR